MLTNAERKELANAAREVASEFAEGRGPSLEARSWCGCALAKVVEKAGILNHATHDADGFGYKAQKVAMAVEDGNDSGEDLVSTATRHEVGDSNIWGATYEHIPGAVVFPLLWLADALEAGIA